MSDVETLERTLQAIATEQAAMREQIRSALKRIDEQKQLSESVYKLASSVEVLTNKLSSTDEKVTGLRRDLDIIKDKPGKRWEAVVSVVITAIATAVITFFLTQNGLK